MVPKAAAEVSEYERKRLETIAKNKALFRDLAIDAAVTGLAPSKAPSKSAPSSKKRKRIAPGPRIKQEIEPRRVSARIRGIVADSEVERVKLEEYTENVRVEERKKRQRVSGDLKVEDILADGQTWNSTGNFLRGVQPAKPYERTFDPETSQKANDKEVKGLIGRMSGLDLWHNVLPADIKLTPERVYSINFHSTEDKALVFAGDKLGSLGIFDSSQSYDADDEDWEPEITTLKIHARTISSIQCQPTDPNSVYCGSYDSTIRKLDLSKGVAVQIYAPEDPTEDEGISQIQLVPSNPDIMYFTTLQGRFGMHDNRSPPQQSPGTSVFSLSEKKIGGFNVHPGKPHMLATASLDRTLKLWDLRKITGKGDHKSPNLVGEHENRLSVSNASFNYAGQVATASYDDTVKIYDFNTVSSASIGIELTEEEMKPTTVIKHNNQTGRWVTILKPQWQLQPQDGLQRLVIGNMNRFVDIYSGTGQQLAQLGGDGISAVPAVAQFHSSQDWVAAATASGKLCLWM